MADWSEPRELGVREWTEFLRDREDGAFAGFMDGAVRFLSKNVDQTVLASIMTPRYGQLMYSGPDWPVELVETSTLGADIKIKGASDLKRTAMQASAVEPLDGSRNQLWCATFQLAWDTLKEKTGGDVRTGGDSAIVKQLNAHPFPRQALDPSTYLIAATGSGDQETRQLRDKIQAKFPGMLPQLETLPNDGLPDLRLYACLVKRMPFVEQLDRFPQPLEYHGAEQTLRVRSFGRQPSMANGLGSVVLAGQVVVADYESDQRFVLILNTNSPQRDEIILGRVAPENTLRDAWEALAGRLKSPNANRVHKDLHDGDRLEIPILEFGVSQNFPEIEGLTIESLPGENRLRTARQIISFRLDETGAEIIAEAESMVVGENGFEPIPFDPTKPRRFVFDAPFLMALRESGKDEPYFLAWIADPELMVAD